MYPTENLSTTVLYCIFYANLAFFLYESDIDKQMDVRDMSCFPDESFDGIIDKGTSLFICYGRF
jgi:hypothetical protein